MASTSAGSEAVSEQSLASFPARRKARKRAVDVLYEAEQRDEPILSVLADRQEWAARDSQMPGVPEFSAWLVQGVAEYLDPIDDAIEDCTTDGRLDRIAAVDRNILRVATYELRHGEPLDDAVAISEAVKIAEVLCAADSPKFINGVLQHVAELPV